MAVEPTDRSAGGVILTGPRVVVLLKRANGELRLPKGHLDAGESVAAAALREVTEETGFADLETLADLGETTDRYRLDGHRVIRLTRWYQLRLATWRRTPRTPKDARRFAVLWMDVEDALDQLTFDSERRMLEAALGQADGGRSA